MSATGPSVERVDVAIVGAGLSGLSAARTLVAAGASVVVLEARDRVGGKLFTPEVGGVPVDLGAHWVGFGHRRVKALAGELDIPVVRQRLGGKHVMALGRPAREVRGETPLWPIRGTLETGVRVAQLELAVRRVDAAAPWSSPRAEDLDGVTLADWMGEHVRTPMARAAFTLGTRTTLGVEPSEISLLAFFSYARTSGGLAGLLRFRRGAQDSHLVGGTQQLATRLADELGVAVLLDTPATAITAHTSADGTPDGMRTAAPGTAATGADVTVTAGGRQFAAGAAIVAVSPAIAERIVFTPELPTARRALGRRSPLGAYLKAIATYPGPWWQDQGRSGLALDDRGPVQMVVDVGHGDGGPGVLAAFVTGDPARRLGAADPAARREEILTAMAALLGPRAADPADYRDLDWKAEPWSGGAPAGVPEPGVLAQHGAALRAPVGPVHWAGTDVALEHAGYMEGAIEAGERAARAVLGAMQER